MNELDLLQRAHALFADVPHTPATAAGSDVPTRQFTAAPAAYLAAAQARNGELARTRGVDAELSAILAQARRDHGAAHRQTGAVLDAARADATTTADTPVAQRELLRRRVARLRAQHDHVLVARRRARRRAALLRALRYRLRRRRLPLPNSRAALAVRAALSRLGCPYVWGATGPDRFDCSGLVQWAYARAGIHLDRTTYQQINDGVPIARSQVRPGDLVFPHAGHVQMAIGNNLVIEAPHAGANVRISQLGEHVAIRRPV
ncbi:C40 family peptidase [Candidatus Mycolicibacterium alkanivorans]|uniref:C40 family peptidase n=1 Tax=Candidatus Mycolicibacterium alkanivorans TaxID=2954114 RepID=A0ABS9YRV5_9MYCO|nr:C40 family peptidase [Candidatus Mycolicibacterium alkanivorans]MCI4673964.1 C40 family peptidase [Candidatus Mycolicibacterium alkanivorans]